MTAKPDSKNRTPQAQLKACIDKLDPKFPTANELAYDYGRALVIGYAPGDRGIDGVVAIRADAKGVSLYFNHGPQLPDPKRLMRGSGMQTRFLPVEAARDLAHPDVEALLAAAMEQARVPLPSEGKGSLIVKSDGAKNPPRRKPSK